MRRYLSDRNAALTVRQGHSVLQVEVALAIEIKALVLGLDDASVDGNEVGPLSDGAGREVPKDASQLRAVDARRTVAYLKKRSRSSARKAWGVNSTTMRSANSTQCYIKSDLPMPYEFFLVAIGV
jgi:hypothetical protein